MRFSFSVTGAGSASNRTAMMDREMTGWVTTKELAVLLNKSYDATRKYAQRGGYILLRQTKARPRSRGGKIWLININDPAIPDSAREKYFAQLNRPKAEVILSTVEAMRHSVDKLLQEVKAFNLAFNRFADMFCSFCEDQDEATR